MIIITCIFGTTFKKLYPSPLGPTKSFIFSDNADLKKESTTKGWQFIYIDILDFNHISNKYSQSSLKSKYVKFLQVAVDFPNIFKYQKQVMYFDHKFEVKKSHVDIFLKIQNPGILIRTTPRYKATVYDEIEDASHQLRYCLKMKELKKWVKIKLLEGYNSNTRVCNTGLILYNMDVKKINNLCDEMYSSISEVENPECQVFWSILSQKYDKYIKTIDFNTVPIRWLEPS